MPRSLQVSAALRLFLALWLAITPTFVWAGSMTLLGVGGPAAGGGACSDTDATNWKNAVVAASGTVSAGQATNVCNLIACYKTNSIYTLLDREWLYASENVTQAKIDITPNLGTHTVNGSPTFTANQGYTGTTNIADFINTGYASGTNFTKNANSFGAYVRDSRTSPSPATEMGNADASGSENIFRPFSNTSNLVFDDNNGAFPTLANANAQGSYLFSRTSSTNIDVYKNASSIGSGASTTFTFPATNFYALAWNNNGTTMNATSDQLASVFMGGALNSTQAAAKNSCLNTYMTAVGANVY